MCKLSLIAGLCMLAVEVVLYWRMRKLRAKWIAKTKEYEDTLQRLGIPRNVL